ncbi:hypothetical protein COLO4_36186 [Corchorus olitorius]|uniref:Uncharacterized protein n=1 Tax=Corchorus olitorius TaxID=93759 RepID=A0A1R3GAN7_9ROSI|nr:hypothetical protein COLO4_36186 [Corchorus olitorius]
MEETLSWSQFSWPNLSLRIRKGKMLSWHARAGNLRFTWANQSSPRWLAELTLIPLILISYWCLLKLDL